MDVEYGSYSLKFPTYIQHLNLLEYKRTLSKCEKKSQKPPIKSWRASPRPHIMHDRNIKK